MSTNVPSNLVLQIKQQIAKNLRKLSVEEIFIDEIRLVPSLFVSIHYSINRAWYDSRKLNKGLRGTSYGGMVHRVVVDDTIWWNPRTKKVEKIRKETRPKFFWQELEKQYRTEGVTVTLESFGYVEKSDFIHPIKHFLQRKFARKVNYKIRGDKSATKLYIVEPRDIHLSNKFVFSMKTYVVFHTTDNPEKLTFEFEGSKPERLRKTSKRVQEELKHQVRVKARVEKTKPVENQLINKKVSEIVTMRRQINRSFQFLFNDKEGLFRSQEVATSDIREPCSNEDDFSKKILILGGILDEMETKKLKNLIKEKGGELKKGMAPISVLESFLELYYPNYDRLIISNLRNIKTLRSKKYPIHRDDIKWFKALKYFGFTYPPHWGKLWLTLLDKYLESLKKYMECLNSLRTINNTINE